MPYENMSHFPHSHFHIYVPLYEKHQHQYLLSSQKRAETEIINKLYQWFELYRSTKHLKPKL
jgi:hypothetical protein